MMKGLGVVGVVGGVVVAMVTVWWGGLQLQEGKGTELCDGVCHNNWKLNVPTGVVFLDPYLYDPAGQLYLEVPPFFHGYSLVQLAAGI